MRGPGRAAWVALPAALLCGIGASAQAGKAARLPVLLDHNRILVEVLFQRKDGSLRKAEAWVDTGNPALVLGGPLAQDVLRMLGDPAGSGQLGGRLGQGPAELRR